MIFIGMDIFKMDRKDLDKLGKMLNESPKSVKYVTAGVLNSLAFGMRKNDVEEISASMIIRNRRFVESAIQVDKARAGRIENQIAIVGSVKRDRFSGWSEQENGKDVSKSRAATTEARGGNPQSQVKPKARMKSGNKFYKPSQFQGKNDRSRFMSMMRILGSRGGGEFLLSESYNGLKRELPKGLYRLKHGKIKLLQSFKKPQKPNRNQWQSRAMRKLEQNNDMAKIWAENIERVMARYK